MRLPGSLWTPTGERLLRPIAGGAEWSTRGGACDYLTSGEVPGSSCGTAITTGGVVNTKGSWIPLEASTPTDAHGLLLVFAAGPAYRPQGALVDIAIGAAGSEVVVAENLLYSQGMYALGGQVAAMFSYLLRVAIPAGTRLAARAQTVLPNNGVFVTATLLSNAALNLPPLGQIETYGADTGDSGGVGIYPGTTGNTKASWYEMIAATGMEVRELLIALGSGAAVKAANQSWLFDIGIGAAGAEQVIIEDIQFATSNLANSPTGVLGPFEVEIPTNTRIAARAQSSNIDAVTNWFDLILYGVG